MPKALIITVGTGKERKDIAHAIRFSIKQLSPNYVLFVATTKSKDETLPFILEDSVMQGKECKIEILQSENDVEKIREEVLSYIEKLSKLGYLPKDIVADYTSGTKAMSAGLVLSSIESNLGTLSYVVGERNSEGRVITGNEQLIISEPNRTHGDLLFREAVELFNNCQFDACLEVAKQAKELFAESLFQEKIHVLSKLADAYSLWDKFALKDAFCNLDGVSNSELLAKWGIKSQVEKNKEILYKEKDNDFCLEKTADLLENAKRRGDLERKYDDAVARLYRCFEYMAQFRIAEKGLYKKKADGNPDTENIDIIKLPEGLQNKYEKCKDPRDGKVKLSLFKCFELLADLEDDLENFFKRTYEEENGDFKKLLSLRNNSILAHGFNPIPEQFYKQMLDKIEKFAINIFWKTDNFQEKASFPQIKIQ